MTDAELYLDGYRLGLGAAIRATERVRANLGALKDLGLIHDDSNPDISQVLVSLVSGLRIISASAVVEDF